METQLKSLNSLFPLFFSRISNWCTNWCHCRNGSAHSKCNFAYVLFNTLDRDVETEYTNGWMTNSAEKIRFRILNWTKRIRITYFVTAFFSLILLGSSVWHRFGIVAVSLTTELWQQTNAIIAICLVLQHSTLSQQFWMVRDVNEFSTAVNRIESKRFCFLLHRHIIEQSAFDAPRHVTHSETSTRSGKINWISLSVSSSISLYDNAIALYSQIKLYRSGSNVFGFLMSVTRLLFRCYFTLDQIIIQ